MHHALFRLSKLGLAWLGLACALFASEGDIPSGANIDDVIQQYGAPHSRLVKDNREVLIYPNFEAVFIDGHLIKFTPVTVAAAEVTVVEPTASSTSAPEPTANHAKAAAHPVHHTTPITIGGVAIALWPFYLVLALLAFGAAAPFLRKAWLERRKAKLSSAPPPPKPAPVESPGPTPPAAELSLALIESLEWKQFALLVQRCMESRGLHVRIDEIEDTGATLLSFYEDADTQAVGCVYCLAGGGKPVDVSTVRTFRGIMAMRGMNEGALAVAVEFTEAARDYAAESEITLLSGSRLLEQARALSFIEQQLILAQVAAGDFTTPTCPRCTIKLVLPAPDSVYWICRNAPTCKVRIVRVKPAANG